MGAFGNQLVVIGAHPFLSGLCFLVILFGVVLLFSGKHWQAAWGGIARVFATIFTTPFEFLRNALLIVRTAKANEANYANTREFVLFRYSRIQYLTVFAMSALLLATTISSALIVLYPQREIAATRELKTEATDLNSKLATAQRNVQDSDKPEYKESLQNAAAAANKAVTAEFGVIARKKAANTFSGPILNQIDNASTDADLSVVQTSIDTYFAGCPGGISPQGWNWMVWTAEQCAQFRAYTVDQIAERGKLIALMQTANSAQQAIQSASSSAETEQAQVASLQTQIENNTQSQKASSPWAVRNIASHVIAAFLTLLSGAFGVITFVWIASILLDILNWIILLMRSLEAEHEKRIPLAVSVSAPPQIEHAES
ncbi:MAG TPA: hypothetical protein VGL66_17435 [Caulobacteraceae bacterium]